MTEMNYASRLYYDLKSARRLNNWKTGPKLEYRKKLHHASLDLESGADERSNQADLKSLLGQKGVKSSPFKIRS